MNEWRLIVSNPGSGADNMAMDEALWESFQKTGRPFLRFYTWQPAALSLGRFQNLQSGLDEKLFDKLPKVRRITGGGAIWHDQELTYSLACSQEDLAVTGVKASFEKLTAFLLETWRGYGWQSCYAKDLGQLEALGQPTVACFSGKEEYDILVNGKKLGGNAQSRSRNRIFQHGSLPYRLDFDFLTTLFLPGFAPSPLETTSLNELGWEQSVESLREQLAINFEKTLNIHLFFDRLSDEEHERTEKLSEKRYSEGAWLEKGQGALRSN